MNLIIVESPTKARTLSRFLGQGYTVEATMGHIKDLPKSRLGIEIEKDFEPEYVDLVKKDKVIKNLVKNAKKASVVYLATDPDREGEAIAKHVEEVVYANGKSVHKKDGNLKRIVFHEITKDAVEEALGHPREIDENLVNAQIARRVLDRLVGYKLSPLLWKKVRRGLSAGRVQSVAVRLIVEREREIDAFKTEEYWEIYAVVKGKKQEVKDLPFTVQLIKINDKKAQVGNGDTAKSIVADLQNAEFKVADVVKKEVRKNPYPPFTTSTMTQAAARLFGWSAKKSMSVAQHLYEEGLITYHRTDSTNIAISAVDQVRNYIKNEYGSNYLPEKPRFYKTKSKVAQEAHEAIRPTDVSSKFKVQNEKFERDGEVLYDLIWRRFVACQMNPSIYDETRIDVVARVSGVSKVPKVSRENLTPDTHDTLDSPGTHVTYLLRASGQIMKFDGWRKLFPISAKKNGQTEDGMVQLPEVVSDDPLQLIKVDSLQKFTQPPPRYNESSLIKTLEKLGIGRPSTYAPIISTIQIRQYVEKKEGRFYPTSIGIAVVDFLTKNFADVFEYSFTAQMEDNLDKVATGEVEWHSEMSVFWKPFSKKLESVEKTAERVKIETEKLGRKCPTCDSEGRKGEAQGDLVIRVGRFGKFISCSLFPECKHTEKYVEKIDMACPECGKGEVIIKTTRSRKRFFGCSRYPDCKWASWKKPTVNESISK